VLSRLKGWKYGFESPFKADVYYVITRLFTGNKWGTSNPIMMRDQDFGIVRVRAFGTYDFRISDPKAVSQGSGGHGSALPPRGIRGHDAIEAGQRLQRGARREQSAGARRRHALQRARFRRCCRSSTRSSARSTASR
jgi:hypothetical protein